MKPWVPGVGCSNLVSWTFLFFPACDSGSGMGTTYPWVLLVCLLCWFGCCRFALSSIVTYLLTSLGNNFEG